MIPIPFGVRVWIATGHTDMRRGMNGLALQVQQALKRDPHAGDLFVFRGRRGNLVKVLWHDTLGMSLYAKRLERGKFIWPLPADGVCHWTSQESRCHRQPGKRFGDQAYAIEELVAELGAAFLCADLRCCHHAGAARLYVGGH